MCFLWGLFLPNCDPGRLGPFKPPTIVLQEPGKLLKL